MPEIAIKATDAQLDAKYGLPKEVRFCTRCVMSNQRPASMPEFRHRPDRRGAKYLHIDAQGVCDACRYADKKEQIDWKIRESELLRLLDTHRCADGGYDCIVPGSGGKDSAYAAHLLKYKYGMHPLTVTWTPTLYTDYGWRNFRNWIEVGGFDNVTFKPNGRVHRLLTRLAIEHLLHPFQTFILGQKNLAPKMAARFGVPLIFYGESEAEYGNPIAETATSLRDASYYTMRNLEDVYLAGLPIPALMERHGLSLNDLSAYLPADGEALASSKIEVHYLGYYLKWTPQEAYYYAVEHTGFQARPFRTEGTYSKYNSIDDKIDDLHYYTTHIKFGLGRASYDASQEIRNKHLTREEGVALVRRFDGEVPERYVREVMGELGMKPEQFFELCDRFRSPHLWKREGGAWSLKHHVS
ncbi:MAG: LPS biosynthesis protein PseA [Candidatus Omnitrophica bacterium CG11_big_fil_rev_8_21_14_0_20_63_9]|nr:MAG: LPS biosynthesis protein PseA [Candidatus Omnitrophica bacterium CG11_big_fil_rev_8_21_14_0_20_63_9]